MEHIKNIEIQNFKSIKHCVIDGCKRINVFVGPPNVGKSNILEGLGLSCFFKNQPYSEQFNQLIRFETFNDLIFNGNSEEITEITINNIYRIASHIENNKGYEILLELLKNEQNYKSFISRYVFNDNNEIKVSIEAKGKKQNGNLDVINVKKYLFKNLGFDKIENDLSLKFPNGINLFDIISINKGVRKFASDLFKIYRLKLNYDSNNKKLKILKEIDEDIVYTIPFNLTAETLQRLIFHIAAIKSNKETVLLFEEPESHCYEPYILDITNAIKYDEQNNQYFIVTHSQYIVSEFLRDEESRNNTNIYLVGLDEDGSTKVKLIDRVISEDVYRYGTNVFFNYDALWKENN